MRGAGGVSPSFWVLDYIVDLDELVAPPRPEWESIYCSSKKAYGCGKHGQELVEGLALYAHHRCSGLPSSLCIRLSDQAFRSIRAELGYTQGRVPAKGVISNASQQLLVLLLTFHSYDELSKRRYCLVFDSTDASLCMVPYILYPFEAHCTATVIPLRGAAAKDHELVLMVNVAREQKAGWCRLCVCSPATRAKSESGDGTAPWKVTEDLRFPLLCPYLSADVMFSSQGKVFWADPSQGVAYCDLRARDGALKFNFIKLPKAYRIHWDWSTDEPRELPLMSRTMGCVGGSIKFICIDRSHRRCGSELVRVWTLDLDNGWWKESKGILWKELWKKVRFMPAEHRDVVPQFPTLMPDGALCLLCKVKRPRSGAETDFICSFDMCSKSLLSSQRVVDYDTIGRVPMPYNFFTLCNPPPPPKGKLPSHASEQPAHKKKLPTQKRKLPTIWKETSKRSAVALQQGRN